VKEPFVYYEFGDLFALTMDPWFDAQRKTMASTWFANVYRPSVGTVYEADATTPGGFYAVSRTLEVGAALVEAGQIDGQPAWTAAGKSTIDFIYAHASVLVPLGGKNYRIFPRVVEDVLSATGSVNKCEQFRDVTEPNGELIHGASVHAEELGRIALVFLRVYLKTKDGALLKRAQELLDNLTDAPNPTGLWDTVNLGYYRSHDLTGADTCAPGTFGALSSSKECGRQEVNLEAYHFANLILDGRYCAMEEKMLSVITGPAYFSGGHGYVYQRQADWSPVGNPGANFVTTESMGISLETLQNLVAATPQ
jgi:hypothetical protein